jgi:hypothetical protein
MVFIETRIFSRHLAGYLSDDEYRELQAFLSSAPAAGDIIKGAGGIRKLRWGAKGKGKRGGVRIIYYWQPAAGRIYLLTLYAKNEMSDLSSAEVEVLRRMVEEWNE